jgi:hypothetical protein
MTNKKTPPVETSGELQMALSLDEESMINPCEKKLFICHKEYNAKGQAAGRCHRILFMLVDLPSGAIPTPLEILPGNRPTISTKRSPKSIILKKMRRN